MAVMKVETEIIASAGLYNSYQAPLALASKGTVFNQCLNLN
jgi:hypothetical protein